MYQYKYETHLHTMESSACAVRSGKEQVRKYKELGYTGIIVTDHFFNGNTSIDRHLPWDSRVDLLFRGFDNAKEEGDRIGLDVFCGWEVNYETTEFLIYGLDKNWLKSNPNILDWSLEEHNQRVREDGGFVVHAHPFRERWYIPHIRLFPDLVDGVEVINIGNAKDIHDEKAKEYAIKHNLPMIAGTDTHDFMKEYSGVAFEQKLKDINDFIMKVKSREGYDVIDYKRN